MTPAFGNSTAKCSMKARTDGSRLCRYGTSAVSVASPAIQSGSTRRNAPISHHHDKRSQAGHYAKAGNRSLLERLHVVQRDGSLAVRRTRAMSTDGWQFSGDAVRFLQGGQRPRCVAHVRPCLPKSSRKLNAGAYSGAAFDERRVLGPRLTRIFCDKIA